MTKESDYREGDEELDLRAGHTSWVVINHLGEGGCIKTLFNFILKIYLYMSVILKICHPFDL